MATSGLQHPLSGRRSFRRARTRARGGHRQLRLQPRGRTGVPLRARARVGRPHRHEEARGGQRLGRLGRRAGGLGRPDPDRPRARGDPHPGGGRTWQALGVDPHLRADLQPDPAGRRPGARTRAAAGRAGRRPHARRRDPRARRHRRARRPIASSRSWSSAAVPPATPQRCTRRGRSSSRWSSKASIRAA